MSIQGGVTIRVTPERLKTQADEVSRRIIQMKRLFGELERVIGNTRSYWIGEAGNRHRQAYTERKDELETMFTRLEEELLRPAPDFRQLHAGGERDRKHGLGAGNRRDQLVERGGMRQWRST